MPQARWTPRARRDLKELAKYVAIQGQRPMAADQLVDQIRQKADEYASRPDVGSRHPELPDSMRVFIHKRYVVIYEPADDGLIVLRVVDGARDFSRLFR